MLVTTGLLTNLDVHTISCSTTIRTDSILECEAFLNRIEDSSFERIPVFHVEGCTPPDRNREWPGQTDAHITIKWERLLQRIESFNSPVISILSGSCSGIALELSVCSDYKVALSNFCTKPGQTNKELWPSTIFYRLPRLIGESRARKILLTSNILNADLLLRYDLLDQRAESYSDAINVVIEFLRSAPLHDFSAKRNLLRESSFLPLQEALGSYLASCDRFLNHHMTKQA